jgi:rhodanese-related sulfurtransferase
MNVAVFREGIPGWAKAGYRLAFTDQYPDIAVPVVSASELYLKLRATSMLVDVRPEDHFLKGHIGGSTNIDLEDLYEQFRSLPKDKKIVLIDHKGKLTLTTARFLAARGYKDVVRLDGGFNAWAKYGLPVKK